ncbi:hypothetical protein N0V83_008703 [Neocucurbitaria cava]|uniref:Uncharacterized protein n=1 Tax=Neocucurbitaria cava TaxID=798079 RepID=A0A9W9CI74_9PLEO|nr:hypothetical protein N0V83_008703 [Neocucurbitaria cava]
METSIVPAEPRGVVGSARHVLVGGDTNTDASTFPTSNGSFGTLPTELKLEVLEEIYHTGTRRDFLNTLSVNKEWNALGTPLLWTFVAINNHHIVQFIQSLKSARRSTGKLVRNLSVLLNPIFRIDGQYLLPPVLPTDPLIGSPGHCAIDHEDPQYMLWLCTLGLRSQGNIRLAVASKQLADLIKSSLNGLITFSYRITPSPANPSRRNTALYDDPGNMDEKMLPLDLVAALLDSLPQACSQVELILCRYDIEEWANSYTHFQKDTNAMCEALDRLLPRLTHLHLEGMNTSPFVFGSLMNGPKLPHLKGLCLDIGSIYITDRRYAKYAHLGPQYALENDEDELGPARSLINWLRLQNIVARELRSSYATGRFPSITQLHLMGFQGHGSHVEYEECRVNTIDILKECIMVTPNACMDDTDFLDDTAQFAVPFSFDTWIIALGRDGRLRFVDVNEYEPNDANPWISSTSGTRIPASTKFAREVTSRGFEWVDLLSLGMNSEKFLDMAKPALTEFMLETAEMGIDRVASLIRAPYVIKGLLEWYD